MKMSNLKLRSCEGEIIEVDPETAECSLTIVELAENLSRCTREKVVFLPNVSAAILKKVMEWCAYHKYDPPRPLQGGISPSTEVNVSPWDQEFFQVDNGTLFELILAANYLNVKELLTTGCKVVANMMMGKSAREMRKMFQIKPNK